MRELIRLVALGSVFTVAAMAWLVLGGVLSARTHQQERALEGAVSELWGRPMEQAAPDTTLVWSEEVTSTETALGADGQPLRDAQGRVVMQERRSLQQRTRALPLDSTRVEAKVGLDQRRKGLMWYALYDVDFRGVWAVTHDGDERGHLNLGFAFPGDGALYDNFRFVVNGVDVADGLTAQHGNGVVHTLPIAPGETVTLEVSYRSRGLDHWSYRPGNAGSSPLRDFQLALITDFADIDYPAYTLSPSARERVGEGWRLNWTFERVVTGQGMGVTLPQRVQPGPLAAAMSFSAPISLGLFMLWIYVLGLLRKLDIHPVNHLMIAGAFFAFHLLFGYTADHLPVEWAFGLSAVVSVTLVVSYLRLVVGAQFAWREAGLAQLLYLVGFSLAHFWEGFTGLTVTVMGVLTLFALMQLTGRIKWSEVFEMPPTPAPTPKKV